MTSVLARGDDPGTRTVARRRHASGAPRLAGGCADGGMRLRAARQARGYSQQQLAGMAGVSRQAVSAVEAGHSDPSLRVALALASALGLTVEELFGPRMPAPVVGARPVAPLGGMGARVSLAPMGESFVALPMLADAATRTGFRPAGGVVALPADTVPATPVRPLGPPRPTLVVAGCDPALPLLETPLAQLDPPVGFSWWPCGSGRGAPAGRRRAGARGGRAPARPVRRVQHRPGRGAAGPVRGRGDRLRLVAGRPGAAARPGRAGAAACGTWPSRGCGWSTGKRAPRPGMCWTGNWPRPACGPPRCAVTAPGPAGTCRWRRPPRAGWPTPGWPASPPRWPTGWPSCRWPRNASTWSSRPARRAAARWTRCARCSPRPWLLTQLGTLPGYDPARCGEHVASL